MRPVLVETKDARPIARGHPWVYRQAIIEKPRTLGTGKVCDVAGPARPFVGRGIYDSDSPIAVRVWTTDETERINPALLVSRFEEAAALRIAAGVPARTDAYRVVNAEGDRMPGVLVDRFGDWLTLTLQTRSLHSWQDRLVAALVEAVPCRGIYLKGDKKTVLVHGESAPEPLLVEEPTIRVRVMPDAPGKSGLFTDMREARVMFAPLLAGRSFLNLFAHTGAFSAAAARAGASEVVTVDISGPYLQIARANVELSAPGYETHTTIKQDVFHALDGFAEEGHTFEAILIDPPTFSTSRKSGSFNVREKYRALVRRALRVLAPRGLLACATNFRGVTRTDFQHWLQDAAESDHVDLRVLTVLGQPADHPVVPAFPEGAYLHFALCSVVPRGPVAWRP